MVYEVGVGVGIWLLLQVGPPLKGFGGRFGVDPYKSCMAVSITWESLKGSWGSLKGGFRFLLEGHKASLELIRSSRLIWQFLHTGAPFRGVGVVVSKSPAISRSSLGPLSYKKPWVAVVWLIRFEVWAPGLGTYLLPPSVCGIESTTLCLPYRTCWVCRGSNRPWLGL